MKQKKLSDGFIESQTIIHGLLLKTKFSAGYHQKLKTRFTLIVFFVQLFNLVLAANDRKQNTFTFRIEGNVKNFQGKYIFLHHKWDYKDYTDSSLVSNNKFVFDLKSSEPNMYWFTLSREVLSQPNVIFFVDEGTISVEIFTDSLASSKIDGGRSQKEYLLYRNIVKSYLNQQKMLQEEFTLASQQRDQEKSNKINQSYTELTNQHINRLEEFIGSHSKSPISGYIVYNDFSDRNWPIERAVRCLSLIDKGIQNTKFVKLASKKINDRLGTQISAKATDFSQPTVEGKPIKLSDYRGKFLLLDFWASWCAPCRLENPYVVAAFERFKSKGFTVLSVSLDTNKDQWLTAIKNDHLNWTHVSDLKGGGNDAANLYDIRTIPQNVLIDKHGTIVAKNLRGPELDEKLKTLLE